MNLRWLYFYSTSYFLFMKDFKCENLQIVLTEFCCIRTYKHFETLDVRFGNCQLIPVTLVTFFVQVQVIPWVISDSNYVRCPAQRLDPSKTVFVGALHGMLNAEALASIMNDLFGGVMYAGIDTDKHKYPIGETVSFSFCEWHMLKQFVDIVKRLPLVLTSVYCWPPLKSSVRFVLVTYVFRFLCSVRYWGTWADCVKGSFARTEKCRSDLENGLSDYALRASV